MAMFCDFQQLDEGIMPGKPVVILIDLESLLVDEIEQTLDLVNLIKLKRDGIVKVRSCANKSKQKYYLKDSKA